MTIDGISFEWEQIIGYHLRGHLIGIQNEKIVSNKCVETIDEFIERLMGTM